MPHLAFFPWIDLECDIEVGGYSLMRFVRGTRPRPDVERQSTLDSVLTPYRNLRDEPVRTAVILSARGRGLTDDLSEDKRADLFLFAELFAFAALAAREFFSWDYFNRDHLRLVIQAFTDPRGGTVVETRQRDGFVSSWIAGHDYRVQVPAHVSPGRQPIKLDGALLDALLASRELEAWPGLLRGIALFNRANTDAPDVSPDIELVLTYAAMEQILGIRTGRDQRLFPTRFAEAWRPNREIPRSEWRQQPTGGPCKEDSLRACWASDLKICRGNLAHGHGEVSVPARWTVRQHLLLTSFAIPRLVKQVLSQLDLYDLTDADERDINALEPLLNLPDILARIDREYDEDGFPGEHYEWQRVLRREKDRQFRQLLKRAAEELFRQPEGHADGSAP